MNILKIRHHTPNIQYKNNYEKARNNSCCINICFRYAGNRDRSTYDCLELRLARGNKRKEDNNGGILNGNVLY